MTDETTQEKLRTREDVKRLQDFCHTASRNAGWWPKAPWEDVNINPTKLCLIHSEISEAMEGDRKDAMDDKLPHRKALEVELADAMIRILDLAGANNLDLGAAMAEKMDFNSVRPDHTLKNRAKKGGKKY